jgi:AbrB family looped-hinge helix DNA binding protein
MAYKFQSTLTSKGQITLPVELRRRWDLKPGDQIDFSLQEDGRVVLRKWVRRSIFDARTELPELRLDHAFTDDDIQKGRPSKAGDKP